MNQQIKIWNQSAKILENYVECRIHKSHSNNIFSYTKFVPNNVSNKITLSIYTETHANTTKIDLLDFLEFLKWARWGKQSWTIIFISVHSSTKLHQVYLGILSLVSIIIKSFTNHKPKLYFWTIETPRFLTHKNLNYNPVRNTLIDIKSH